MNNLTFDAILLTIAIQCDDKEKCFIHSRYQKSFYKLLSGIECHRCLRRIPRSALLYPEESQWRRVLGLRNNQALITLTRMDFVTFEAILESLKYYYDNHTTFTEDGTIKMPDEAIPLGQPRLISSSDGLGLVLTWTRTCGSTSVLQLIFGMTQSSTS